MRKTLSGLAAAVACLSVTAAPARARTITWSGYTWEVRNQGLSEPGPNVWSDSPANVAVDGGDLVLSVARDASGRWASAEVDNTEHLGYGTYRFVVDSDLSTIDAHEVLGMFTWGDAPPSNNEIDIEAARWGNLAWPSGSGTVWQDFDRNLQWSKDFAYTARPPYVNQFTWEPGKITYIVTDATGRVLFDKVVTSGVPAPSVEVPVVNYWRFENDAPAAAKSMRIASFTFTPLGAAVPRPVIPPAADSVMPAMISLPAAAPGAPPVITLPAGGPGAPPGAAAPADTVAPVITVRRPARRAYRRGQTMTVRYACSDGAIAACVATLSGPIATRTLRSSSRTRLSRPGRYRLAVTAADTAGNTATETVRISVR